MREKPKGGPLQGVALSKGTKMNDPAGQPRYAGYTKSKVKNYAGQSRAKAAANMRKGY